jgi:hypothetical protein
MRDLLLVVPSRGRPQNIARLWSAMQATCKGDTTLLVGVDDDDPALDQYPGIYGDGRGCAGESVHPWYHVAGGMRQVVAWLNALSVPHAGEYRWVGHIGDDNVPSTPGWDVRIMDALRDTPLAFGNDLYPTRPPGSLCCHVFAQSRVITALGYFGPPSIRHMYVDVAWYAWGMGAGITFLPDVVIEHLHYTLGRAPFDASNAASLAATGQDLAAWHVYSRDPNGLNADIRKIDPAGRTFSAEALAEFNANLNIPQVWPY